MTNIKKRFFLIFFVLGIVLSIIYFGLYFVLIKQDTFSKTISTNIISLQENVNSLDSIYIDQQREFELLKLQIASLRAKIQYIGFSTQLLQERINTIKIIMIPTSTIEEVYERLNSKSETSQDIEVLKNSYHIIQNNMTKDENSQLDQISRPFKFADLPQLITYPLNNNLRDVLINLLKSSTFKNIATKYITKNQEDFKDKKTNILLLERQVEKLYEIQEETRIYLEEMRIILENQK